MSPQLVLAAGLLAATWSTIAMATVHDGTIRGDEAQAETCFVGSSSRSLGSVTYDDDTGLFSWSYTYGDNGPGYDNGALFEGGSEIVSHFHGPARPGLPGAVQVDTGTGTPNTGSTTITPTHGANLLAELWYLNIHTSSCASGEIRGQVVFESAPVPPSPNTAPALFLVLGLIAMTPVFLRLRRIRA